MSGRALWAAASIATLAGLALWRAEVVERPAPAAAPPRADPEPSPDPFADLPRTRGGASAERAARAGLERAGEARAQLYRAPPEERPEARRRAADAYRAVRALGAGAAPRARELAAQAAFRAGELLRAGGWTAEAALELCAARALGDGTPVAARASLELGHVHRREGRAEDALDAYARALFDAGAPARWRDEAAYWSGRVQAELGRASEARRLWRRCADGARDPVCRVRAWDRLVLERVAAGDLEGAAGLLARAREELAPAARERTRHGARVGRALERMRGVPALADAVRRRFEARAGREEKADNP